jgi:hypothetical protein
MQKMRRISSQKVKTELVPSSSRLRLRVALILEPSDAIQGYNPRLVSCLSPPSRCEAFFDCIAEKTIRF